MKNVLPKIIYCVAIAAFIACLFVYGDNFNKSVVVDLGGGEPVSDRQNDSSGLNIGDFPGDKFPDLPKFPDLGEDPNSPLMPIPELLTGSKEYIYSGDNAITAVFDTSKREVVLSVDGKTALSGTFTVTGSASLELYFNNDETEIKTAAEVLYNSVSISASSKLIEILQINNPFLQEKLVFYL